MFHSVAENGYFSQSFQKVEPGRIVRLMLMPASRTWAATASQVPVCQPSSIEISSNSVSAWPASAISAFGRRRIDDLRGQFGVFRVDRADVVVFGRGAATGIAKLQHDRVGDRHLDRLADA